VGGALGFAWQGATWSLPPCAGGNVDSVGRWRRRKGGGTQGKAGGIDKTRGRIEHLGMNVCVL
jgi:hypothetical protein